MPIVQFIDFYLENMPMKIFDSASDDYILRIIDASEKRVCRELYKMEVPAGLQLIGFKGYVQQGILCGLGGIFWAPFVAESDNQ